MDPVQPVDRFTIEVLRNAFASIVDEMGVMLMRCAMSPVITQGRDFSGAVLTADGELVMQGALVLPGVPDHAAGVVDRAEREDALVVAPAGPVQAGNRRHESVASGRDDQLVVLVGHALLLAARMAQKEDPSAGVLLPLSRGSVEPVDASAFKGVRFEVRGDGGEYAFTVGTQGGRWRAPVKAAPEWTTVEIPFADLKRVAGRGGSTAPWTGTDLIDLGFSGGREPGQRLWLQVDNVTFY